MHFSDDDLSSRPDSGCISATPGLTTRVVTRATPTGANSPLVQAAPTFSSVKHAVDRPVEVEQTVGNLAERRTAIRFANREALPATERALSFGIANSRAALESAFKLVGRSYCEAGLEPESRAEIRVFPHHALDTTQVFHALHRPALELDEPAREDIVARCRPVATVSLMIDGQLGLPMDHVAQDSLGQMRDAGYVLAEMNSLAMVGDYRQTSMIMRLHRIVVEYAALKGVTHLAISSIYRHASMYQRCLGFEPLGPPSRYWDGEGVVVQPMHVPIERVRRSIARFNRNRPLDANLESFFFGTTPGADDGAESGAWTREDINYFLGECQAEGDDWVGTQRLGAWSGELQAVTGSSPH